MVFKGNINSRVNINLFLAIYKRMQSVIGGFKIKISKPDLCTVLMCLHYKWTLHGLDVQG